MFESCVYKIETTAIQNHTIMLDSLNAHQIMQESGISYALVNRSLTIVTVSDRFHTLLEEALTPCVGRSLLEIAPELVGSEELLAQIMAGEAPLLRLPMVSRELNDDRLVYLNITVLPHLQEDHAICGLIFVAEDITEMAQIEQAVTQHRNELTLLRDQLSAQNMQILAANAELRRLDVVKSRFVSIAAHELRSPLATISGYLSLLTDTDFGSLSEQQTQFTDAIERGTDRLVNIIDDLLDITRISVGRLDIVLLSHDLDTLIRTALADLHPHIAARQHTLEVSVQGRLPEILCDKDRLVQVLHNLVINASKYTPDGGQIKVMATRAKTVGQLQISVIDNGIGIPAADHDHIFDTFFRASNVHHAEASGTGLGLHITRSLVELHGGEIWFESESGKGTRFHVTFPSVDETSVSH